MGQINFIVVFVVFQFTACLCQDNSTCLNGGTLQGDGSCQCLPNLSGSRCQTLECNGPDEIYCTTFELFLCDSIPMYNYSLCPIRCGNCSPMCRSNQCQNGGMLDDVSCTCACPQGYGGEFCQERDCSFQTCLNGGVVSSVTCGCLCPPGGIYSGKHCEIVNCSWISDAPYCDPTGKSVICNSGFMAPRCPFLCGLCSPASVKVNCSGISDAHYCDPTGKSVICNSGFMAAGCPFLCGLCSPAFVRVNCTGVSDAAYCDPTGKSVICSSDFMAPRCPFLCGLCSPDPSYCDPAAKSIICNSDVLALECPVLCGQQTRGCKKCENGGTLNTETCECYCHRDWKGEQCEQPLCDHTCFNGGSRDLASCYCRCAAGWSGISCEVALPVPTTAPPTTPTSNPTPPSMPNTEVTVGDEYVYYRCKKGSVNTGGNIFNSTLKDDGKWTSVNFVCTDVSTCYVMKNRVRVYSGTLSVSSNDRQCQAWSQQTPNRHPYRDTHFQVTAGDVPETLEEASNYCRDPGSSWNGRLWCFNGEGRRPRVMFCNDVPPCQLSG